MTDPDHVANELSPDAKRLLDKVRERQNSHPKLKSMLDMVDDQYDAARRELLDKELVRPLQCFRGGLRLPAEETSQPPIDEAKLERAKQVEEETEKKKEAVAERAENELYPYMKSWAEDKGFDPVEIVGSLHRRDTWENPDLIALTINEFEWFVGREIEVATIEVKLSFSAQAIWQAAHYRSFSHYSYLACFETEDEIRSKAEGRLFQVAVDLGLGIIVMTRTGHAGRGIRCNEIHSAARQSPRLLELERLLADYRDVFPGLKRVGRSIIDQMQLH